MPDVVVVFGVEMDSTQAELTRSAIELCVSGYPASASEVISKMGQLGYNHGLAVVSRELIKRGFPATGSEALKLIRQKE